MLDVGGNYIVFRRFIYGLPREVFAWSNFSCDAIAIYVRARCGLVRTTLHYQRKYVLRLLTILRNTYVTDIARNISIFIISLIPYFMLLVYVYKFNNRLIKTTKFDDDCSKNIKMAIVIRNSRWRTLPSWIFVTVNFSDRDVGVFKIRFTTCFNGFSRPIWVEKSWKCT